MVVVEIRAPVYDEEVGAIRWHGCGLVRADGDDLDIFCSAGEPVIDANLTIIDPATNRRISGDDDPEAWARNLPSAFRHGDLVAVIVIDTDPVAPWDAPEDSSPSPVIPSPPVTRLYAEASARRT